MKKFVVTLMLASGILSVSQAAPGYELLVKLSPAVQTELRTSPLKNQETSLKQRLSLPESVNIQPAFEKQVPELDGWFLMRSSQDISPQLNSAKSSKLLTAWQENHAFRVNDLPNDSLVAGQWYYTRVRADHIRTTVAGLKPLPVALIDTGVDYMHPDLQGSLWVNPAEDLNGNGRMDSTDLNGIDDDGNGYVDDIQGWDFVDAPRFVDAGDYLDEDNDPMDQYSTGHGTPAAGIMSAIANNSRGIAGMVPGLQVLNLRAGTASGYLEEDDVARAILYAVDNGARVINMSFGDLVVSLFLEDVIRYAYRQGAVLISSSGNSGSNQPGYPAGFSETISVGATGESDNPAGFSNWGNTLDLVAPGVEMITTLRNGQYGSVNGTSFSAPVVSAAAALTLALHPELDPEQVRTFLKTTCDDIGYTGWDEYTAAGRVNLETITNVTAGALVKIHQPRGGSSTAGAEIPVIATVAATDLRRFRLFLRPLPLSGSAPDAILEHSYQVVHDTIFSVNTVGLSDGEYLLRLEAELLDGSVIEERSLFRIDRSPPVFERHAAQILLDGNQYSALLEVRSDDEVVAELAYHPAGTIGPFEVEPLAYHSRNQRVKLNASQISGDVEYLFRVENDAGLWTYFDNNGANYRIGIPGDVIPPPVYPASEPDLPAGYALNRTTDFDGDGFREVILSRYDDNNAYGPVTVYEAGPDSFRLRMETAYTGIPRDVGDADNDGLMEILVGYGRISYLIEASAPGQYPTQITWVDTADFWGSRITDLDNDGLGEILGRVDGDYALLERSGDNQFQEIFRFANPSEGENVYGPPRSVVADLDGDGMTEVVFGDYDGDIIIYENTGNNSFTFRQTFRLPLPDATDFFAAGNLISDTHKSLVAGCHTSEAINYEHEFDARYWRFFVIETNGPDSYFLADSISIYGYSDTRDFDSGVAFASGTGPLDNLYLAAFPDLYALHWEDGKLQVNWHRDGIATNTVISADLTGSGERTLLFNGDNGFTGYRLTPPLRPALPARFSVLPEDSTRIDLSWSPVPGADRYVIYRGSDSTALAALDSLTDGLGYTDTTIQFGTGYFYAICTVDEQLPQPRSRLAEPVAVRTSSKVRLSGFARVAPEQVMIRFSRKMSASIGDAENYRLSGGSIRSVVAEPARNRVLVTFTRPLSDDYGIYELRLKNLRAADGMPLAYWDSFIQFSAMEEIREPYVREWQQISRTRLQLVFSVEMDALDLVDVNNYGLEPAGQIVAASVLSSNPSVVELEISRDNYAGATGRNATLILNGLHSADGVELITGKRIGLAKTVSSIAEMYVYPQPYQSGDETDLYFAAIPRGTEITIYTIAGEIVAELQENDGNGGVAWNGCNLRGEKVAAGVYIYRARIGAETKLGKLTIVR